nr:hypothetical protein cemce18_00016 [uncultured bacterium]
MKNYLLTAAFMLSLNANASIEGTYNCSGTDKEHPGVIYKGIMTIKKTGETYSVKSSYSDNVSSIGTGIYNQAKHHFVFVNPQNRKETGIASMRVSKNHTMTADWTYLNQTLILF